MKQPADTTIWKLRLVYALLGMMLWYGIEQLFLNRYTGTASARGYVTVVFVASLVLFDVPMGIIADRIGRKICLLAACVAQAAGLLILGASNSLLVYLIGSAVFGLYLCLFNGAAQALLYDHLASRNTPKQYAKQQGALYAWWLSGAGIANLASGFVAHALGLRSAYFLSLICSAAAFCLLLAIAEPPFSKKQASSWYAHLSEVFLEIRNHWKIIGFGLQFLAATLVLMTVGEFGQIYILSFGVGTIALGLCWAATAAFAAGGRALAHRLQAQPRLAVGLFCAVAMVFSVVHGAYGIGLFWLVYGLNEMLANIAETEIQDATSDHIRATMLSVANFAGNTLSIPIVLMYTAYYRHHGIFAANRWVLVAIVVVLALTLFVRPAKRRAGTEPAQPQAEVSM